MTFRKYLVLAGITLFAATGDSLLSHGMKQVGSISLTHWTSVIFAVLNPSVALGILLLLGFFISYTTALSWADLTYVLPASSLGYVLLALIAKFFLHEHVSTMRWFGIALVRDCANFLRCRLCHPGPGSDAAQPRQIRELARYQDTAMKDAYTWGAILVIVLASSTGDVLLSRAMKQIGDVGNDDFGVLQLAVRALLGGRQSGGTGIGIAHLCCQCHCRQDFSPRAS